MRSWSFWDWTGFAALWITVAFSALIEALKKMPRPPTFTGDAWTAFLPFVLLMFATIVLAVRALHTPGAKTPESPFPVWPDPYVPVVVAGRRFINQEVLLDGHRYVNCTFENCTFKYNGTTPVQFQSNAIHGRMMFSSENVGINGAWMLAVGTGLISADTELVGLDPSNQIGRPVRSGPGESPQA